MITIDLIKSLNVKTWIFPDGQPHVAINPLLAPDSEIRVVSRLRTPLDLMNLLQVSNAADNLFLQKKELVIPYLMGARSDRLMQKGDSVDLKVVAEMINSCDFKKVNLFDVHSDVATQLINRSVNHNNSKLVNSYDLPDSVLICPDVGAAKKIDKYLEWNTNIVDVVYSIKRRDLSNGKITLEVLNPERCEGKNCVIIDDLIDGGATFIAIAEQIKAKHLTLIVSHGIFSKGFSELEKHVQQIIVSDSYNFSYPSHTVKLIQLGL